MYECYRCFIFHYSIPVVPKLGNFASGRHLTGDTFAVTAGYYLPVVEARDATILHCTQDSPHGDTLMSSCSVMSNPAPHGLCPTRHFVLWIFQGKNYPA